MGKYIVKRMAYIVLVFFILSFMIFMIYNMLPSDKAAESARAEITANRNLKYEERYEYWQKQYGTNGTKIERYFRWLGVYPYDNGSFNGLLQGNLGTSTKFAKPVAEVLVEPMKNTIFINIFSTFLALGITIPLGIFCAVKRGSKRDVAVQVGTVVGYSLPTFIIAIVFIWLFAVILGWFPVSGMQTAGSLNWSPWRQFWDRMYHFALPLIVMTFSSLGGMTRYVRAAMIEALNMDCIRTARAKGLPEKKVINHHAFRNILIPIITLLGGTLPSLFSGAMITETLFQIPGIGYTSYTCITQGDIPFVMFYMLFSAVLILAGNLIADILYAVVDPRVRVN